MALHGTASPAATPGSRGGTREGWVRRTRPLPGRIPVTVPFPHQHCPQPDPPRQPFAFIVPKWQRGGQDKGEKMSTQSHPYLKCSPPSVLHLLCLTPTLCPLHGEPHKESVTPQKDNCSRGTQGQGLLSPLITGTQSEYPAVRRLSVSLVYAQGR